MDARPARSRRVLTPVASALVANQRRYFKTLIDYRAGHIDDLILNLALAAQVSGREALVSAINIETMPTAWLAATRPRAGSAAERIINLLVTHPVHLQKFLFHLPATMTAPNVQVDKIKHGEVIPMLLIF